MRSACVGCMWEEPAREEGTRCEVAVGACCACCAIFTASSALSTCLGPPCVQEEGQQQGQPEQGGAARAAPSAGGQRPAMTFIDFEYAERAPRGFDIGNHFCE